MYPDFYIWKSSHYNRNLGRTKTLKVKADSYNNKITYCTLSLYNNTVFVLVLEGDSSSGLWRISSWDLWQILTFFYRLQVAPESLMLSIRWLQTQVMPCETEHH